MNTFSINKLATSCVAVVAPLQRIADAVKNSDTWEFVPWQSVGAFKFYDNIANYKDTLSNWEFEPKDEYCDECYRAPNGHCLGGIRNNKIWTVFCYHTLTYQNTNLIGLTIDEFKQITQANYVGDIDTIDFEDDGYPQNIYRFESIGVQVWEKQGKIVAIIVAGKESYLDELDDES